ncbi:MAG: DUF1338 domain-containing protein [Phycisphaeraceae bacterium]
MSRDIHTLLERLWNDYTAINPQAGRIHELLASRGETIVSDHIALRTFDDPRVSVAALSRSFVAGGYEARGEYTFPEKKLFARHFEHASGEAGLPRVFISELKLGDFSPALRKRVAALLDQMPADLPKRDDFPVAGRPWNLAVAEYEHLRQESEYAAWMSAFGFRANHFTVLVNALKSFDTLEALNVFLKQRGFALNATGGEIKGSPGEYLQQSSTLASQVPVAFTDSKQTIPGCYYEFARRYPLPDGTLFSGFVAKSADKIFQSTDRR